MNFTAPVPKPPPSFMLNTQAATPTGTEALVCADIAKRQAFGIKKYGMTVADNPLELLAWLQHAYEESMDQTVYLRRTIEEVKAKFNLPGAQNGTQAN